MASLIFYTYKIRTISPTFRLFIISSCKFSPFQKINYIVFPLIKLPRYPSCFSTWIGRLFLEKDYLSAIKIFILRRG
ncbi:hypothetical protein GJS26_00169 [Pectobacterium carotovorum subsp. carotovorum]|nr:hypothetical protein [Pectobacterium carotovorum subsp. carotovorum]